MSNKYPDLQKGDEIILLSMDEIHILHEKPKGLQVHGLKISEKLRDFVNEHQNKVLKVNCFSGSHFNMEGSGSSVIPNLGMVHMLNGVIINDRARKLIINITKKE